MMSAKRSTPFTALVPKAPLDALVVAFDKWLGSGDDNADADLIDALGDFIERLGVKMPTTGEAFRNRAIPSEHAVRGRP